MLLLLIISITNALFCNSVISQFSIFTQLLSTVTKTVENVVVWAADLNDLKKLIRYALCCEDQAETQIKYVIYS